MSPSFWDHGFVAVLLLAIPIYGRIEYVRLVRRFTVGGEASREEMYRSLGLRTISPTKVGAQLLRDALEEQPAEEVGA